MFWFWLYMVSAHYSSLIVREGGTSPFLEAQTLQLLTSMG